MYSASYNIGIDISSLADDLNRFSTELRNKIIKDAVKAASVPIEQVFRQIARTHRSKPIQVFKKDGTPRKHFADSIKTKIWVSSDHETTKAIIGPTAFDAPHAHFLEDGTVYRFHKSGHPTGAVRPFFVLSTTFQASFYAAEAAFLSSLKAGIESFNNQI